MDKFKPGDKVISVVDVLSKTVYTIDTVNPFPRLYNYNCYEIKDNIRTYAAFNENELVEDTPLNRELFLK